MILSVDQGGLQYQIAVYPMKCPFHSGISRPLLSGLKNAPFESRWKSLQFETGKRGNSEWQNHGLHPQRQLTDLPVKWSNHKWIQKRDSLPIDRNYAT